jgi:histone H3/H4
MLLKKTPLKRLVREIMGDVAMYSMKLSAGGFTNLHEACEDELVKVFQNAGDAAAHAGRITIFAKDMAFCEKVRKNHPNPVMGYKFNEHASGASPHSSVSTASRRRCGSGSRSSKKQVQKKPSGAGIEKTKKKHKHKSSKQPTSSLLQPPKAQKAPKPQPQQPLFQQMPRKAPRKMPIAAAVAVADDEESSHSSEIDMTQ